MTGTVVPLPFKGRATPALARLNIAATVLMVEGRAATLSAARIDAILIRLFQQQAEITAVIAELAARLPSGQSEVDTLNTALAGEAYKALAQIELFIRRAQNCARLADTEATSSLRRPPMPDQNSGCERR